MLTDKKDKLEIIAQKLLEKEIIFQSDLEGLIGKRPFEKQTTYAAYTSPNGQEKEKVAPDPEKVSTEIETQSDDNDDVQNSEDKK